MNKLKFYGLIVSLFLLLVLAACGPVGKVPLDAMPTSTPTPAPVLEQAPLGLAPACTPDEVTIDKVTSFCANPAADLGGATFLLNPSLSVMNFTSGNDNVHCDQAAFSAKVICSGPPNEEFQRTECTSCGQPASLALYEPFECADGFIKDNIDHYCMPVDLNDTYALCPAKSHYDNDQQICVDDGTGQPISICPPGFPYLTPNQMCFSQPYPEVFNCQTFTVQLGDCSLSPNPPGGGNQGSGSSEISCPSDTSWDAGLSCCVNADHRCQ
jgi:hypothetical protein